MKVVIKICLLGLVIYMVLAAGVNMIEGFKNMQDERIGRIDNVIEQLK